VARRAITATPEPSADSSALVPFCTALTKRVRFATGAEGDRRCVCRMTPRYASALVDAKDAWVAPEASCTQQEPL
jgi:hypothetical protein